MSMLKLVTAISLGLLSTDVLVGQGVPPNEQKSARQLVAEYAAAGANRDRDLVSAPFRRGCPREDARRDSIFEAFLELEPTHVEVYAMAERWAGHLDRCNDPRLDSWFRQQARKWAYGDQFMLMAISHGLLLVHPTPENVAVMRQIAVDSATRDDARMMLLSRMIYDGPKLNARGRVDLLAEVYERAGRIPEPYHSGEVSFFKKSPEVGYWRTRLTEALLRNPGGAGSIELLQHLGTDVIFEAGGEDAVWAGRFREALLRLERDTTVPEALRQGAARTRQLLDSRRDARR
jgi:hypothetical protein